MRESPDLCSGGMSVPDKQWNASYIHVVYVHVLWGEHLVCVGVT